MTAIEFRAVSFVRPGHREVLRNLNLSIAPGQVVALVGRSGAGKTTILKLANGLLTPASGAVLVDGRDTRTWEATRLRRHMGYVLQDVGLFPNMTVEENITLLPRLEGWPADRLTARATELLALVGLAPGEFARRWPDELSGGQRQRVGVARALALDPPVLLMDEPFGSLDPITRAELHAEFSALQHRLRKSVVLVTHDMAEAFALGDRIGVLDAGELVACDAPDAIAAAADPRVRNILASVPSLPGRVTR